jgi:hypothetical protein
MITHDEQLAFRHQDRPEDVLVVLEHIGLDLRDAVHGDPALGVATLHGVARYADDPFDDVFVAPDRGHPVAGGMKHHDVVTVNRVQLVRQLVDEHAVVVALRRAAVQRFFH